MSGQVSPFFPTIEARNLEGRRFRLPANFATELSLAVVAFERWHQELVDSWTPTLEILAAKHAGLRVYELPIISTRYGSLDRSSTAEWPPRSTLGMSASEP